jgi:hypothetical protein
MVTILKTTASCPGHWTPWASRNFPPLTPSSLEDRSRRASCSRLTTRQIVLHPTCSSHSAMLFSSTVEQTRLSQVLQSWRMCEASRCVSFLFVFTGTMYSWVLLFSSALHLLSTHRAQACTHTNASQTASAYIRGLQRSTAGKATSIQCAQCFLPYFTSRHVRVTIISRPILQTDNFNCQSSIQTHTCFWYLENQTCGKCGCKLCILVMA